MRGLGRCALGLFAVACVPTIDGAYTCAADADCLWGWRCDGVQGRCSETGGCGPCPTAGVVKLACADANTCVATACAADYQLCAGRCIRFESEWSAPTGVSGVVRLDLALTLHLAYETYDAGNSTYAVHYARRADAAVSWDEDTLATGLAGLSYVDPWLPRTRLALSLDATGSPQVVYFAGAPGQYELRHAAPNGGGWSEVVLAGTITEPAVALDRDGQGYAHVLYATSDAGELRYTRWDGVAWQDSVVDTRGVFFGWPALRVVDSTPHLAFTSDWGDPCGNPGVVYGRNPGAAWQFACIPEWWVGSSDSALALSADGVVHLAYQELAGPGAVIRYRAYAGDAFAEPSEVDACATCEEEQRYTSIAIHVDDQGEVHVGYFAADPNPSSATYQARYVHGGPAGWCRHTIAGDWLNPRSLSLTLAAARVWLLVGASGNLTLWRAHGG